MANDRTYFSPQLFRFMTDLGKNNNRDRKVTHRKPPPFMACG